MRLHTITLPFISFAAGEYVFYNPPAALSGGDNEVWSVGSTQTLHWSTNLSSYSVVLWQQNPTVAAASPVNTIDQPAADKDASGDQTYPWVVNVYDSDLTWSNVYFFWIANAASSHYINITNVGDGSTMTTSSASTRSSATSIFSTTSSSTTSGSYVVTPSSATTPSSAATSSASASTNDSLTIGLGVGLGIGIPLLVALGALIILLRRRKLALHTDVVGAPRADPPTYLEVEGDTRKPPAPLAPVEMPSHISSPVEIGSHD